MSAYPGVCAKATCGLALLIVVAATAPAHAAPTKLKLGIFNVQIVGLEHGLSQTAMDALATSAAALGTFEVVSRAELDAMLGAEKLKDQLGCDDVSCMAEIGAAAGVQRILNSSVSKIENALVVSLQLVNTEYASVENRVTLTWEGSAAKLPDVLAGATQLLLVPVKQRQPGSVHVSTTPLDAVVSLDGKLQGSGNVAVEGLPIGVHQLKVEAPGYTTVETPIMVLAGQPTQVPITLNAHEEAPFYSRWWFWTIAGGVVAAGTSAAVLLSHGSDSPSSASGSLSLPSVPGGAMIAPVQP